MIGEEILPYFAKIEDRGTNSIYDLPANAPQFLKDAVKTIYGTTIRINGFNKNDLVKIAEQVLKDRRKDNVILLDEEKQ